MSVGGAVDGILVWMQKPNVNKAKRVGVNQRKFLCGRKHKFGQNCQALADVNGKILYISVVYGASAADCVAFEASDLHARLEDGLLQNGYVLFGDNAYLNSFFMAKPYSNVSGNPNKKSEDNYNFFHSQLRIRVECAFGINSFSLCIDDTRSPLPSNRFLVPKKCGTGIKGPLRMIRKFTKFGCKSRLIFFVLILGSRVRTFKIALSTSRIVVDRDKTYK